MKQPVSPRKTRVVVPMRLVLAGFCSDVCVYPDEGLRTCQFKACACVRCRNRELDLYVFIRGLSLRDVYAVHRKQNRI